MARNKTQTTTPNHTTYHLAEQLKAWPSTLSTASPRGTAPWPPLTATPSPHCTPPTRGDTAPNCAPSTAAGACTPPPKRPLPTRCLPRSAHGSGHSAAGRSHGITPLPESPTMGAPIPPAGLCSSRPVTTTTN